MKRADLIPGQDYLVNGSPDWDRANAFAARYRIIDTTSRWGAASTHWGSRSNVETVTLDGVEYTTSARRDATGKAHGVLALKVQAETGLSMGRPEVIQAGPVRMTWAEWEPRHAAHLEQAQAARARSQELASARANRLQFAGDRLRAAVPSSGVGLTDLGGRWTIDPAALEALLDKAGA